MKILTFELKVAVSDKVSPEDAVKIVNDKIVLVQSLFFLRSRYVEGVNDFENREAWIQRAKEEVK